MKVLGDISSVRRCQFDHFTHQPGPWQRTRDCHAFLSFSYVHIHWFLVIALGLRAAKGSARLPKQHNRYGRGGILIQLTPSVSMYKVAQSGGHAACSAKRWAAWGSRGQIKRS
jgi:hypothetical protein